MDSVKEGWGRFLISIHIRKKPEDPKIKNVLPDLPEESIFSAEFVERHRVAIGGILLVLILLSGGFLLYRENYFKPVLEKRITDQDARIEKLEAEIGDLSKQNAPVSSSAAVTATAPAETGQIAGASTSVSASSANKPVGKINLNTATAAQLDTLPGIGTAYATRIIDYRTQHGGFKSIEELKNVKGIGDKTFEKLADLVTI